MLDRCPSPLGQAGTCALHFASLADRDLVEGRDCLTHSSNKYWLQEQLLETGLENALSCEADSSVIC